MIKKLLLSSATIALATTTAFAADLPSRRAPPAFIAPIAVPYSWSGLEVGLSTTYVFTDSQRAFVTPGVPGVPPGQTLNKNGLANLGGGIAYNYQFTPGSGVVVGVKADADWTSLNKNNYFPMPGAGYDNFHNRLEYLATINGRVGYAFDRVLVYGTGGFAFGGVHEAVGVSLGTAASSFGGVNRTDTGYNYGGGIEYAIPSDSFLNNFSVEKLIGIDKALGIDLSDGFIRAEFIHYNLGTDTFAVVPISVGGGTYQARFHNEGNEVRLTLGYKFGGTVATPVVARY